MQQSVALLTELINTFSATSDDIKKKCQQNVNSSQHFAKFDIENWYNLIESLTFRTIFIPLSVNEAKQVISLYEQKLQLEKTINDDNGSIVNNWMIDQIKTRFHSLILKIKKQLDTNNMSAYFCKMSSRTPKDSIINKCYYNKTKKMYLKYLKISNSYTFNDKKIALNQTMIDILKCENILDILVLFVNSKRIYDYLKICLNKYNNSNNFSQNIIIREWYPNLNVMYEFRGFVFNNKLNGVSQYRYTEKVSFLLENSFEILTLITNFWEIKCEHLLNKFTDYIIDFLLIIPNINSTKNWDVKIIKLNPYTDDTGALLFSWNFDRKLLKNGPFQMRLQYLEFGRGDLQKLYPIHKRLLIENDI